MSSSTRIIRLDEGVREEITKNVFNMSSEEFEAACRDAVAQRTELPVMDYVTRLDPESGMITRNCADGRVEYVLT